MAPNSFGLCECGCGETPNVSTVDDARIGAVKGRRYRFVHGHGRRGPNRRVDKDGYVKVLVPGHPRGVGRGWVLEHIVVAEKVLGKPLPSCAQVHHVNEVKSDNATSNLAILQSQKEHNDLHYRLKVLRAGGDPFMDRLCIDCRQPKSKSDFYPSKDRACPSVCIECSKDRVNARNRQAVA